MTAKDTDLDPNETQEWLDALQDVIDNSGVARANIIINKLLQAANSFNCDVKAAINTPYVNTILQSLEDKHPGNLELEEKLLSWIRWNAMIMVVKAGSYDSSLGGHIGTFASAANLYDIGFYHFWRSNVNNNGGDLVFFQGHASPGIYARSFIEGRFSKSQVINFRQEANKFGLSSYPHPWLMPDYWQFATVSMGLGPIQAIYQARFMRYLENRNLIAASDRKIWCFCGDGEMDEPESVGALSIAAREGLNNLIFVVNCNLQRLDGPVRGNGKIVQELEAIFTGAGWRVIKILWGSEWDPLLEQDANGLLKQYMMQAVDGEYQNYAAHGGAYTREHFFGKDPQLKQAVAHLSDAQIANLRRGGHDPQKVYAGFSSAFKETQQPVVILAQTIKGYGLGSAGEAKNTAHNTKKLTQEQIKDFRERFKLTITDAEIANLELYKPDPKSAEIKYLKERRKHLGGDFPARRQQADETLKVPSLESFATQFTATGEREISTTMAFVRILVQLCKDKELGKRIVPIVPDEARTFGMEGLFRQFGIYAATGQLYSPVDAKEVMFYKESKNGQMLQEGLNEAGAFCSWLAAATSYSNHNLTMIPFYIFYSMFGLQRVGDLFWAAGDMRARGFIIGATAGRTTLNGEGLQHEDGHSHILAGTIPNCISFDPSFHYELAVIIQYGLERMVANKESVYFYITVMNENYSHPEKPDNCEDGIRKGLYCFKSAKQPKNLHVQLLGSGTIFNEVIAASDLLLKDFDISSDLWSATSFNELARDGQEITRWNRLNPLKKAKVPYIAACLDKIQAPVIAATDYMKNYVEQVRGFISNPLEVLGTDGFGRSDTRAELRKHFEVDRFSIVIASLTALLQQNKIKAQVVAQAIKKYGIDSNKSNPVKL